MSEYKCQLCGNADFSEKASYCKACGTPVHNSCTNEACGDLNQADAAYCEYCGWATTYNNLDIVIPVTPLKVDS